jgi:surface adhesion protein
VDTITDWSNALIKNGGDVLDLRDLLVGGTHGTTGVGNLTNYLHFETSPTSTTVDVSSSGGYSAGYVASATDQKIVLQNMDLSGGGTLSNDAAIIHDLLSKGKLQTY